MLEILSSFSLSQIIAFIVLLAIATKEVITLVTWFKDLFKKKFSDDMKNVIDKQEKCEEIEKIKADIQILIDNQQKIFLDIKDFKTNLNVLIGSDKDDIKSWITEKHHFYCYEKFWIDDYSMDCIEKRYKHYKDEGGNSFIGDLMADLRNLPKMPPQ